MSRKISLVRPSQIIDAFIDDFLRGTPFTTSSGAVAMDSVSIDMYETDKHVVVEAAVPGFKPEDIKISIEDGVLTIEGSIQESSESKGKYYMKEIYAESFVRSVSIPARVDVDNAEANMKDGVMTITLPKVKEAQAKSITIKKSE